MVAKIDLPIEVCDAIRGIASIRRSGACNVRGRGVVHSRVCSSSRGVLIESLAIQACIGTLWQPQRAMGISELSDYNATCTCHKAK